MEVVISDHARFEMIRRQLSEEQVKSIALDPQQVLRINDRTICQSRYYDINIAAEMLLRVICEERQGHLYIITAYRTSKIQKYWREG